MLVLKKTQRKNPQDSTAPAKFYAHAIATGDVSLERLAYLVSNQCTVRESDCHAVLMAMMHNVADELGQGRIVDLGVLGRFQVGVRSKGVEVSTELNASAVKSAHINFRPSKRLRKMLSTLEYKCIDG
jgi:predicted histone-like DNA-binding protein